MRNVIRDWLIFPVYETKVEIFGVWRFITTEQTEKLHLHWISSGWLKRKTQSWMNWPASRRRLPSALVLLVRSLPARSTRHSWLTFTWLLSYNLTIQCQYHHCNIRCILIPAFRHNLISLNNIRMSRWLIWINTYHPKTKQLQILANNNKNKNKKKKLHGTCRMWSPSASRGAWASFTVNTLWERLDSRLSWVLAILLFFCPDNGARHY